MKKEVNNQPTGYQIQVMQAVMEVWEQHFLQAKDWNTCWPLILTDNKTVKGMVKVRLFTGTGFHEEEVNKFKAICIERFGKSCTPAQGKILTYKKNNIRYLLWREPRKNWPTPDFRFDCKWYYEKVGKQWPADILDFGHIIFDDDEYEPIKDKGATLFCAIDDGVVIKHGNNLFVPTWWNSRDGLQFKPWKAITKKELRDATGTVIKEGEKVRATEGYNYCGFYDVRTPDGRIIKNVDYEVLKFEDKVYK